MNTYTKKYSLMVKTVLVLLIFSTPVLSNHSQLITEEKKKNVFNILQNEIEEGRLAGAVSILYEKGKIVQFESLGERDIVTNLPMTNDTIFRIYSMTKPITGTALMILYDKGHFELNDPLDKYIPEFRSMEVMVSSNNDGSFVTTKSTRPITIKDLFTHTGGFTYIPPIANGPLSKRYEELNLLDRNSTLHDMVNKVKDLPLTSHPGEKWTYSISADLQAYLVEVISGRPFDEFITDNIFIPLEMIDTNFYVPTSKAERFSRVYSMNSNGSLIDTSPGNFLFKPRLYSGGGGLVSTASDYLNFSKMLLDGGTYNGKRILSKESVMLMRKNQLPKNINNIGPFYRGNTFGLDFAVVTDEAMNNGLSVGSFWWWGIAGTWFWIDPKQEIIAIGMIQHNNTVYSRKIQSMVRSAIYESHN